MMKAKLIKAVLLLVAVSSFSFSAPVISNIQWVTGNSATVTVTWDTNIPADTQIASRYYSGSWTTAVTTTAITTLVTSHSVAINMSLNNYPYSFKPMSSAGGTTVGTENVIPGGFESGEGWGNEKLLMFDGYDTSKALIKYATRCDTVSGVAWGTVGANFTAYVEYGPTTAYGMSTSIVTSSQCFGIKLTGMTPGQIYHYRLRYANSTGSGIGADYSTPSVPINSSAVNPNQVLVLKNASSPTSVTIADYYVLKRSIPVENVVSINGISDYSGRYSYNVASTSAAYLTIKSQLKAALDAGGGTLKNQIRFIVMTKGLPYSVDGEAIDTWLCDPYDVFSSNPYLQKNYRYPTPVISGSNTFYLMTHLDGPTTEICLDLVDRAIYAGTYGLPLDGTAYFDNGGVEYFGLSAGLARTTTGYNVYFWNLSCLIELY